MQEGYSLLYYAEVDTPLLDAIILLAETMHISKEKLYASFPDSLPPEFYAQYKERLKKRCEGIPVSYIINKKEFYGITFYVDERVLVPRPDTEIAVETVAGLVKENPGIHSVHDLCTGSGCIAISLKSILPRLEISASDISGDALEVCKMNCRNILEQEIPLYQSDLLENIPGKFDLIVANPPYLTGREVDEMKKIGWPEPVLALHGGKEGLKISEMIIKQSGRKIKPGGFLVLESAPPLMGILSDQLKDDGFERIGIVNDLAGRERIIHGRRK